jgi:uncharacterized membrane protein
MVQAKQYKGETMQERRSCSKIKPWIYFFLELGIYIALGAMVGLLIGGEMSVPVTLLFVVLALYKTKSVQRLNRVLDRTEEVRKRKIKERYSEHI